MLIKTELEKEYEEKFKEEARYDLDEACQPYNESYVEWLESCVIMLRETPILEVDDLDDFFQ